MTSRAIARRYAVALFDVARNAQSLDRVEGQLHTFVQWLEGQPELQHVFESVAVPAQKKRAVLDAVLERAGGIDGEVRQLLRLLAERDRLGLVRDVAAAFDDRLRQERRVLQAEIVTAVPLPEAQRASLEAALGRATGSKLTMTERVDPAILGGVIARVGSLVFDGSVTRQLDRMKQQLLEDR